MKVDQNDIYGLYYDVNGDPIDQRVGEVSDTNDYYAGQKLEMNRWKQILRNKCIYLAIESELASFDKYVDKICQLTLFQRVSNAVKSIILYVTTT